MAGLSVFVSAGVSPKGPFSVLSLAGEADFSCRELEAALPALAGEGPALVVVDLSGLSFMDSWALSVVLRGAQNLREAGSAVALAGPQAGVARVLQLSGADTIVPVYPSVQEAAAR